MANRETNLIRLYFLNSSALKNYGLAFVACTTTILLKTAFDISSLYSVLLAGVFSGLIWTTLFSNIFRNKSTTSGKFAQLKKQLESQKNLSKELNETVLKIENEDGYRITLINNALNSIDGITEIIEKTYQLASKNRELSHTLISKTKNNFLNTSQLEEALNDFRNSGTNLRKMGEIFHSMAEKNQVINDIVFKTQLLSFNAAIESARAGQHGKGFAVVAEEIGNLATISGTAAKEIELQLTESRKQIQNSIDSGQNRVQGIDTAVQETAEYISDISEEIAALNANLIQLDQSAAKSREASLEASSKISQITDSSAVKSHELEMLKNKIETLVIGTTGLENLISSDRSKSGNTKHSTTSPFSLPTNLENQSQQLTENLEDIYRNYGSSNIPDEISADSFDIGEDAS